MLLGIERVVARASGHVIGRQVRPTGRWGVLIESAVRFRLIALEERSVGGLLGSQISFLSRARSGFRWRLSGELGEWSLNSS